MMTKNGPKEEGNVQKVGLGQVGETRINQESGSCQTTPKPSRRAHAQHGASPKRQPRQVHYPEEQRKSPDLGPRFEVGPVRVWGVPGSATAALRVSEILHDSPLGAQDPKYGYGSKLNHQRTTGFRVPFLGTDF